MNHSNAKKAMHVLKHFVTAQSGVAMLEFILVMPFLFILIFGGIEITRALLIHQRLERAGYEMASVIIQYNEATRNPLAGQLTESELDTNVFPMLTRIMGSYASPNEQAIIVSSVYTYAQGSSTKFIKWQKASVADRLASAQCPNMPVQSIVNGRVPASITPSVVNTATSFPATEEAIFNQMRGRTNVIVTEVFYLYHPILKSLLQNVGAAGGTGIGGFSFFLDDRCYVKRTYLTPRNNNNTTGENTLYYLPPSFPAP